MPKLKRKSDQQKLTDARARRKRLKTTVDALSDDQSPERKEDKEKYQDKVSTSEQDEPFESTDDENEEAANVGLITTTKSTRKNQLSVKNNTELKRLARQDPEQKKREAESTRLRRQDLEVRRQEKVRDAKSKRLRRRDPEVRIPEKSKNVESMRQRRQDPDIRTPEKSRDAELKRLRRQDPDIRTPEKTKNAESMRKRREDPDIRTLEKSKNAVSMRQRREDPDIRTPEKSKNAVSMRQRREDPDIRIPEKSKNAESKKIRRQDQNVREKEKLTYRAKKSSEVSSYDKLVEKCIAKIRQAPTCICSCCGSLCYEESTSITSKEELQEKGCTEEFITAVLHCNQNIHRLCCTCKTYVLRKDDKKLPRVALANGLDFPEIPDQLKVKHERALIFVNI